MKIALHRGYGMFLNPTFDMKNDADFIKFRSELAEKLFAAFEKDVPIVKIGENVDFLALINKSKYKVIKMEDPRCTRYFVINACGSISPIEIVEVDTSKFWMLNDYDGYESIGYYKVDRNNRLIMDI